MGTVTTAVRGLGEVVLRVRDLDGMLAFYQDVIGLQLLRRFPKMAFLRVADGYGGHTQIVGLFADEVAAPLSHLRRSAGDVERTTLHHFALEIPVARHDSERARLQARGLTVRTQTHPWIGWRSIYVADPEDNVVELVCHDPTILESPAPDAMGPERARLIAAAHLLLIRDGSVLLARRANTGYEDGRYSVVAGHVDAGEAATAAMVREAREEAGIAIRPEDLRLAHVMHRRSLEERVEFFFTAERWQGTPTICEPDRCDHLEWFPLSGLPDTMVAYVRAALERHLAGATFSEYGWD